MQHTRSRERERGKEGFSVQLLIGDHVVLRDFVRGSPTLEVRDAHAGGILLLYLYNHVVRDDYELLYSRVPGATLTSSHHSPQQEIRVCLAVEYFE